MAKKLLKTNVKPMSVTILLIALAVVLLLNLLARFDVLDMTSSTSNILTIFGALFLMTEVAFFNILKGRKKMNILDIVIGVTAGLAIIGSAFGLFGMAIEMLQPIQGLVDGGLMIFVLLEIFRKNK